MMHARRKRPALFLLAGAITVLALLGAITPATAGQDDLAAVRQATARYHDLDVALGDGYELGHRGVVTGCIEHPTDGAMGYHYFNAELFEDPQIDPLRPEGLVYAPGPNGQLRLVAVEWVVPKETWEGAGHDSPPVVLDHDLHILNPALNWYIHHAWIWMPNPTNMFADWNPSVDCPDGVAPPP